MGLCQKCPLLKMNILVSGRSYSFCSRGSCMATLLLILSHFELSRIELPKLTSSILMEIVTILVVLVDQFYSYMHQPIKS